jgi:hypothetical protein
MSHVGAHRRAVGAGERAASGRARVETDRASRTCHQQTLGTSRRQRSACAASLVPLSFSLPKERSGGLHDAHQSGRRDVHPPASRRLPPWRSHNMCVAPLAQPTQVDRSQRPERQRCRAPQWLHRASRHMGLLRLCPLNRWCLRAQPATRLNPNAAAAVPLRWTAVLPGMGRRRGVARGATARGRPLVAVVAAQRFFGRLAVLHAALRVQRRVRTSSLSPCGLPGTTLAPGLCPVASVGAREGGVRRDSGV